LLFFSFWISLILIRTQKSGNLLNYLEEGACRKAQRGQEHDAVRELELLVDCQDDKDCFDKDVEGAKD
jgi:hypothetical protein